uniref:Uncharacterized protein n=1 Tax=Aegilops tauschii TaxID=37682 RepID=M8BM08_AEGTA
MLLWNERNNVREEGKGSQENNARKGWKPPQHEELKMNIDGAFQAQTNSGGWGAVIRDHNGVVQACGAGRLENLANPLHAEVLAALYRAKL